MAYLLDTNIFIDAKNRYYDPKVCPAFWDWLIRENADGNLYSIERVHDELVNDSEDELALWVDGLNEDFFLPILESDLSSLGKIASWINDHQRYSMAAKADFLDCADYFLVAQALTHNHIVVTHEIPKDSIHRVKIPNVCVAMKVKTCTPWDMLRNLKARFVLQ